MHAMKSPLQKFVGTGIPAELKALRRWAPWKAVYNEKRGKWDKLPMNPRRPEYGLSTASPEKWATYDEALSAYTKADGMLQGVGFVMTGVQGLVGIDLDNCIDENGATAPWAKEVISAANSYTEISPSGRGLRIFAHGDMEGEDWTNHEVGIEVYKGSHPRFLTVSGRWVAGTPTAIAHLPVGALAALRARYGRARTSAQRAAVPDMPDILPAADTPALGTLELPPAARDFLLYGEHSGDRSRALHATAVALFSAGLDAQQVLSVLHHNEHTMEVALDHRGQDEDRADAYLWAHQCVKAQPKARSRALTAADFDDMSASIDVPVDMEDDSLPGATAGAPVAGGALAAGADDFEDVSGGAPPAAKGKSPVKKPRFSILPAGAYVQNVRRMAWLVKGVLPQADLGAVFGESGSGKTFWTLDLVCRLALGLPWYGTPTQQCKVLYIAAEGASGMRDRIMAWCKAFGQDIDALSQSLFVLGDQPNLLEKEDVRDVVSAARAACPGVGLVVVDTMAQVTPGANENSGEDMGRFLGHAKAIGKALGAMVLMVGHSGKNTQKGIRGWSGIRAALDTEVEVIRTREFRAAAVTKLKDGVGEGREYRFTLENVLVDWDLVDGEVTSCVIVQGEIFDESGARDTAANEQKEKAKSTPALRKLSPRQEVVLEYLRTHKSEVHGAPFDAVVDRIVEHLMEDGRDGIGFTVAAVAGGQARNITRDKPIEALKDRGLIRVENGKLFFIADSVGETPDEICDF